MSEKTIMHRIMIAMSKVGSRMFRNQVGLAYQGKVERCVVPGKVFVEPGDIVIRQARTVRAGLITGSADLVGWTMRTVSEYDIGKNVAIFTAVEVKDKRALEPEQRQFLEVVRDSGGYAIVARSDAEAIEKLKNGGGIE